MSEKEKQIVEKFGAAVRHVSEKQKEYLLGIVDGIALMSDPAHQESEVTDEQSAN